MSPEIVQLLWYAGFTLLGYLLRHANVGPVLPNIQPPPLPPIPADHPLLVNFCNILLQILKQLQNQGPKA